MHLRKGHLFRSQIMQLLSKTIKQLKASIDFVYIKFMLAFYLYEKYNKSARKALYIVVVNINNTISSDKKLKKEGIFFGYVTLV